MIQLNLLPNVKLEYIKAQRYRRLIISSSFMAAGVAVGLLLLLLATSGLQRKHMNDLTKDIAQQTKKLQAEPQINKILTVQNQLASLTGLHAQKPAAARLSDYLNQVTAPQVAINNLNVDFSAHTLTITGTADALSSVNKYADTLKFTTYTSDTNPTGTKAFSNIVLSNFALASNSQNAKPATYTINLAYDPNIFDSAQNIKLTVPSLTTTRASLNQTSDLFQAAPQTTKGAQ